MANFKLIPVNHDGQDLFTLAASSGCEIVGKPLISDGSVTAFRFDSPVSKFALPATDFCKARATVHWDSSSHTAWDQAGLLFVRPHPSLPNPSASNAGDEHTTPSFVKIGLESVYGSLTCNTSSFERGGRAEWSLWPLPADFEASRKATFQIEKHGAILVCFLVEGMKKHLMRTVSWCFDDVQAGDPDIWVGFYVSHPGKANQSRDILEIKFMDFEVDTVSGTWTGP